MRNNDEELNDDGDDESVDVGKIFVLVDGSAVSPRQRLFASFRWLWLVWRRRNIVVYFVDTLLLLLSPLHLLFLSCIYARYHKAYYAASLSLVATVIDSGFWMVTTMMTLMMAKSLHN